MKYDLVISGGIVVYPGGVREATVVVSGGKIVGVLSAGVAVEGLRTIDAAGKHVLPGGVEPHTHIGEEFPFDQDLASETRSAAAGGITTVFHYNQSTDLYRNVLRSQIEAVEGNAYVDVAYNGIINRPDHLGELEYLIENGVTSFKFFTAYKGDEGKAIQQFGCDEGALVEGFRRVKEVGGLPMVHAENQGIYLAFTPKFTHRNDLAAFSEARPELCEDLDIRTVCRIAEYVGSDVYIVHLAYGGGLDIVEHFRRHGMKVFVETCPHYLTGDKTGEGFSEPVSLKIKPPVKGKDSQELLWKGLAGGQIQTVGCDHVCNMWEQKRGQGDIWTALGAFPGMATRLPLLLSEGVNRGRITIEQVADVTSTNPAKLLGVYPRKGAIIPGADADLVIVDLNLERTVDPAQLQSAADYSPWQGWHLRGWPTTTILRGKIVADGEGVCGERGYGEFLRTTAGRRGV